jgi:hypothetical protein
MVTQTPHPVHFSLSMITCSIVPLHKEWEFVLFPAEAGVSRFINFGGVIVPKLVY